MKRTLLNTALVLVTAATLAACGQESDDNKVEDALSNAGDTVEQAVDQVGDEMDHAADHASEAIEDTMTDAEKAIDDAIEE